MSMDPPHQPTVLLVEDNESLAKLLAEYLNRHGFELSMAATGEQGVTKILADHPDVVILDLMLPGISGLEVCRQVREDYHGAILMLTASQSETDHLSGLEFGADDFVIKPLEPSILVARIRTLLRRTLAQPASKPSHVLRCGTLELDLVTKEACVVDLNVNLTSMEFDVLAMLLRHAGSVLRREEMYPKLIGVEYDGLDRGIDVHVSRIRRKLQHASFDTRCLKSVRGVGYVWAQQ